MTKDKLQELYERLCSGCPSARKCHETCENCEEFEEELQKLEQKEICLNCSLKVIKLRYKLEKCIFDDKELSEPIKYMGIKAYCSVCGEQIFRFETIGFNQRTIKSIYNERLEQKKE